MTHSTTTAIDAQVFDDVQTTYTSADIDTSTAVNGFLVINLTIANAPTDIVIQVKTGMSANPTAIIMDNALGDLRYEDAAGAKNQTIIIPYFGDYTRITATATGTTSSATFTLTVKVIMYS